MAPHSSILAQRRIPWTEEPSGLQSVGVHGVTKSRTWLSDWTTTSRYRKQFGSSWKKVKKPMVVSSTPLLAIYAQELKVSIQTKSSIPVSVAALFTITQWETSRVCISLPSTCFTFINKSDPLYKGIAFSCKKEWERPDTKGHIL